MGIIKFTDFYTEIGTLISQTDGNIKANDSIRKKCI